MWSHEVVLTPFSGEPICLSGPFTKGQLVVKTISCTVPNLDPLDCTYRLAIQASVHYRLFFPKARLRYNPPWTTARGPEGPTLAQVVLRLSRSVANASRGRSQ